MARIILEGEREIQEPSGDTLLEINLRTGVPHVHACGGNARCSTCRVLVLEGEENLSEPTDDEMRLAHRKGLEENIRLACQARIEGDVRLRRLVLDEEDMEVALAESAYTSGRETGLAVLFSDIRGFTPIAEKNLPYDVIHILNRYFRKMGEAVHRHSGRIDKYMGDGMMALFGLDAEDPATACRSALRAGLEMLEGLEDLNRHMERYFQFKIDIGIGVHYGQAIIGEVGHPRRMMFTAIGDAVNVAARIEGACKKAGVPFLVSRETRDHVRDDFVFGRSFRTKLKGKSGDFHLHEVRERKTMPAGSDPAAALRDFLKRKISLDQAPLYLRVAYHDAGTGVPNGAIRFPEEYRHEKNRGLSGAITALEQWHRELAEKEDVPADLRGVSYADMIAMAGAVAVELCNGPVIPVLLGRVDAQAPGDPTRLPGEHEDVPSMKTAFERMGLSARDLTALSGAHTLGRASGRPFTDDLFEFNNSYFRRLLRPPREGDEGLVLLASDRALLKDPETRDYVELYARDEESFFDDFSLAYRKMTSPR